MTLKYLATLVTNQEGLKSHVKIGDVREILGIIGELMVGGELEGPDTIEALLKRAGQNRIKRLSK